MIIAPLLLLAAVSSAEACVAVPGNPDRCADAPTAYLDPNGSGRTVLLSTGVAWISNPDPFAYQVPVPQQTNAATFDYLNVNGRAAVSSALDSLKKNCIILILGQSMGQNLTISVTAYTPSQTLVQQINIGNGKVYPGQSPDLGPSGVGAAWSGRLADKIRVAPSACDRVLTMNLSVSASSIADWSNGTITPKLKSGIARLKAIGYTPSAIIWQQGVTDAILGTSSASWQASFAQLVGIVSASFPTTPWFVATETWNGSASSATIQAAQAAVINHAGSPPIWAGANEDSLGLTNRNSTDNLHWNDTGMDAVSTLWASALHAFGAPF